ncbi:MAG: adenylate/guanylate cyclase domain-containing protein [Pseudomonadota bacterium]
MADVSDDVEFTGKRSSARLIGSPGSGAIIAALGSLATCYSGMIGNAVLGLEGLVFNPHFQAVLMWALALVAVFFLVRDRRKHGGLLPLALGIVATLTLIGTLYLSYSERIEAGAYVVLAMAAFLNQNMLVRAIHDTVRHQTTVIAALNDRLAERVSEQQDRIGRLSRLRHFLAPQIADLVMEKGKDNLLRSHRRYIAVLFCDLRNFTAVSEETEPEELIDMLERFHDAAGARVSARGGTIGFRAGDGLMVFFNDPVPCKEPTLDAIKTAVEIRESFRDLQERWRRLGHEIGIGIGIASGFATLGLIGLQGRTDYTAIGSVVNAAARLCDVAEDGQILASKRAHLDVDGHVEATALEPVTVKGFAKPLEHVAITAVAGLEAE